jgi:hypothetical protein
MAPEAEYHSDNVPFALAIAVQKFSSEEWLNVVPKKDMH